MPPDNKPERYVDMDIMVGKKYQLLKKLGEGSFGLLYKGLNIETNEPVAIKLELTEGNHQPSLRFEYASYKRLQVDQVTVVGFPSLFYFGPYVAEKRFDALVLELLGHSIEDLFDKCNRRFSLKTILQIVIQILSRMEHVHKAGIVHRDIKPENFMFGRPASESKAILHVIDFGLAKHYLEDGKHIRQERSKGCLGTARYMSINTHLGKTQSRRDDLEALGYMFVYLFKGRLPWQGLAGAGAERYDNILKVKKETSPEDLCKGLPNEFEQYLKTVRKLGFEEAPDHSDLRNMFIRVFDRKKFEKDSIYDWTAMLENAGSVGPVNNKDSPSNVKIQAQSRQF